MNRILRVIPIAVVLLLLFAGSVFAYSVDITPAYGDQDTSDIVASPGDQVMYQLWFNPDPEGTLVHTAFVWRLDYDEDELEFDLDHSTTYRIGEPYEWWMAPLKEDPAGFVTAGATTFSPGTTLYEPFLMADLAFTVINPIDDDQSDLAIVQTQHDGFYINGQTQDDFVNFVEIAANHHQSDGADVAPVPIPAAVWLLGSGLLGLIGIRRKRA